MEKDMLTQLDALFVSEVKKIVIELLRSGEIKTIIAEEICLAGAKPGDKEYNSNYAINIGSANGWFNAYGERKIINNPSEKSLTDVNQSI